LFIMPPSGVHLL